jgi:hypothetical protein
METNENKNSFLNDLPFYAFIGMLGLSLVGVVLYFLWSLIAG